MEQYVTLSQVAEKLAISVRTAQNMARFGKLPGAVRIGGVWRVNEAVLAQWLNDRTARRRNPHPNAAPFKAPLNAESLRKLERLRQLYRRKRVT